MNCGLFGLFGIVSVMITSFLDRKFTVKCRSGSNDTGPGSEILWSELMSEENETLLEKKKAIDTKLGSSNFISLLEILIS